MASSSQLQRPCKLKQVVNPNDGSVWLETKDGQLRRHCYTSEMQEIADSDNGKENIKDVFLRYKITHSMDTPYEKRLLEGLIIQTYGEVVLDEDQCEGCAKGNGMFEYCTRIVGHYDGACGNCQRGGRGSRCTIRESLENESDRDREMEIVDRSVGRDGTRKLPERNRYARKYSE